MDNEKTEETKTLSKSEQLKAINAKKKELAEQQKALREELNETKSERIEARKAQAEARKAVRDQKSELRDMTAKIYTVFSEGNSEAINTLADGIIEVATELAGTVRNFAEASSTLEEL